MNKDNEEEPYLYLPLPYHLRTYPPLSSLLTFAKVFRISTHVMIDDMYMCANNVKNTTLVVVFNLPEGYIMFLT